MPEPLAGPGFDVLDHLDFLGAVELPAQVLPSHDAEYLYVHDVGGAWSASLAMRRRIASALDPASSTSHRHEASTTSIRPGATLLVEGGQDLDAPEWRGLPSGTAQPSVNAGRAASRTASARNSSGTLTPVSAAR